MMIFKKVVIIIFILCSQQMFGMHYMLKGARFVANSIYYGLPFYLNRVHIEFFVSLPLLDPDPLEIMAERAKKLREEIWSMEKELKEKKGVLEKNKSFLASKKKQSPKQKSLIEASNKSLQEQKNYILSLTNQLNIKLKQMTLIPINEDEEIIIRKTIEKLEINSTFFDYLYLKNWNIYEILSSYRKIALNLPSSNGFHHPIFAVMLKNSCNDYLNDPTNTEKEENLRKYFCILEHEAKHAQNNDIKKQNLLGVALSCIPLLGRTMRIYPKTIISKILLLQPIVSINALLHAAYSRHCEWKADEGFTPKSYDHVIAFFKKDLKKDEVTKKSQFSYFSQYWQQLHRDHPPMKDRIKALEKRKTDYENSRLDKKDTPITPLKNFLFENFLFQSV